MPIRALTVSNPTPASSNCCSASDCRTEHCLLSAKGSRASSPGWTNLDARPIRLETPARREPEAINQTNCQQQCAPPDISMQVEENHVRSRRRRNQLVNSRSEDQRAVYR